MELTGLFQSILMLTWYQVNSVIGGMSLNYFATTTTTTDFLFNQMSGIWCVETGISWYLYTIVT